MHIGKPQNAMVNNKIEKYAIYSSGFRGLPDGWHNIRSCNFLVGENSTGKSSFLQLIELIDSREHMVFMDILGIVKGLDTPLDVCSRTSGSDETTIGFLIKENPSKGEKRQKNYFGRLATYKKKKDDLQLSRITMLSGSRVLRMKFVKNSFSLRSDPFIYDVDATHAENGKKLLHLHNRTRDRFKSAPDDLDVDMSLPSAPLDSVRSASILLGKSEGAAFLSSYPPLGCVHYGPMRAKARRLYYGFERNFSSSGEHVAFVLREVHNSSLIEAIDSFGKESGLFDSISITSIDTPVKDKPFALQLKKSGAHFYVDELGFGVGQVLPIIGDLACVPNVVSFLIEQPELHLHPRAQAALGRVFFEKASTGTALVIETHSDYIIDRFRISAKQAATEADNEGEREPKPKIRSQIVYFDRDDKGANRCSEIEIYPDGSLSDAPDGYRDFFVREGLDKFEALQ